MLKRISEQDHYQVLEVDYRATAEEIKEAYERAREVYGGDSLVSTSILTAEERQGFLTRIAEAYNTLVAEESRRLYDRTLAESVPELAAVLSRESAEAPTPAPAPRAAAPGPPATAFPRLVKGAFPGESEPARTPLQLGIKEEATGDFLRRARESAGLDLRAISRETKIGVTMLTYIEEERLDRLPVAVYLRNFVCQYARCLGLDEEKVARTYLARVRRLQAKA